VDALWKQNTTHRLDPAKYLPVEIVNFIFSLTIYHVVELGPENDLWPDGGLTMPSRETMVGYRDVPLILASVSRTWCQIAVNQPLLWSTIIIDRSEDDYLERVHLFVNRSGKAPLDIVLLDHVTPTAPLQDLLLKHAHRFKTLVGHSAETSFEGFLARLEPLDTSADFMNWSVYAPISRRISTVPIPKCLHCVQLYQWTFEPESLIQFTYFPNLESLSISIELESRDTQWDKVLWFKQLRHLRLRVYNARWASGSMLKSPWLEWLECPVLVDLYIIYELNQHRSMEIYPQLEACLLRFRFLRNLRVHMHLKAYSPKDLDASGFQDMRPSMFGGSLELVHVTFYVYSGGWEAWAGAFTERLLSVFVPTTHLTWEYGQFPSPTIFTNLKKMHIVNWMTGDRSALVAPARTKLEFPALEELYLENFEIDVPGWLDFHAPRLISLRVSHIIPLDLRQISSSRSRISIIYLGPYKSDTNPWETYLPSADRLQLDLCISDLFVLNVHPSQIHSVAMNIDWNKPIICPPHWTGDYTSEMLGIVTDLNLEFGPIYCGFKDPSQTIVLFLKPFVYLKNLILPRSTTINSNCIDQLAQHLVDPNFLPALEALSSSEYPLWPDFFQCIQRRQYGFLTGQFQTSLKEITIKGPVHGVLLEHLRESIAGRHVGVLCMPPRHKGAKEWPKRPFDCEKLDTNGLLCCYSCYQAGLEIGCMISPSENASKMLRCYRFDGDRGTNSVFAP